MRLGGDFVDDGMTGPVRRLTVEDEAGGIRVIEQRERQISTVNGRSRPVPFYHLDTGESVNRIGTDAFVVVATGERLRLSGTGSETT